MTSTDTMPDARPRTDPTSMLAGFWTQWLEQSTRGTQAMLEMMQVVGDPQRIQAQWLDAVSRSLEQFMRSTAFLELLKNNLKAVTDLKGLQNDVIQDTARQVGIPLTGDITGLYERLHSTEQVILNRLRAIEERLATLDAGR